MTATWTVWLKGRKTAIVIEAADIWAACETAERRWGRKVEHVGRAPR